MPRARRARSRTCRPWRAAWTVRAGTVRAGTVRAGTVRAGTVRAGTVRSWHGLERSLDRQRANALAGRREDGVAQRGGDRWEAWQGAHGMALGVAAEQAHQAD